MQKKTAVLRLRSRISRRKLFLLGGFPVFFLDESEQVATVFGLSRESIALLGALTIGLECGHFRT